MKELSMLGEALLLMDENAEYSIPIYNMPSMRHKMVMGILAEQIERVAKLKGSVTMDQLQHNMDQAKSHLMSNFWDHAWPAHDCHFHKNFEEYCNCPFTCLTEIASCVVGISKKFTA